MKTLKKAELIALVIENFEISPELAKSKTDDELMEMVNSLNLAPAAADPVEKKRVRIIIHEQDGPDGTQDVVIGLNGIVAQIKREHEVALTLEQVGVLDNAVYRRYEPIATLPGEYTERNVRRYNYTILGPA